jgi:hypothetical protein
VSEEEALRLVGNAFRSIWPMELLLVLSQEPCRGRQIDALARELRGNSRVVMQGLDALVAIQLVTIDRDQAYRFQPASAELAELARELVDLYNRKPRAVMRAIFSTPADRIQTFADAFRIRKDTC